MTAREEIAAALNTVDGVTASPYPRQETRVGVAHVRRGRSDKAANGMGLVETWQVWICTGQTLDKAEEWVDKHHDAIVAALARRVLVLRSVTPAETTIGTTKTNVIIYEGTR